jgi:hypothetical protein
MAYYYLNKIYSLGVTLLVILCHLSGALAALYPTQPVAKTIYATGSSALVTWKDDTRDPHVSELGPLMIKLFTAQAVSHNGPSESSKSWLMAWLYAQEYVTTLAQGVNPTSYGTLVMIPTDLRNDTL